MENKVIKESYNKETGYCEVIIQNKYGRFKGTSQCHPDDMEHFSVHAGSRYAEIRANEEYAKFRYNLAKNKLTALKEVKHELKQLSYNSTDDVKKVERQLNLKIRDYTESMQNWENLYKYLGTRVNKLDEEREKILNRTKKDN